MTLGEFKEEPEWCPKCQYKLMEGCCAEAKKIEEAERKKVEDFEAVTLGGRRAWREYRADAFDIQLQPSSLRTKYKEALDYASTFDSKKDNLFLYGPAGCGKSHLATIALRRSPASSRRVVQGSAFSGELMKAKMEDAPIPYFDGKTLLLDDIEKTAVKEFGVAEIQRFVNKWYQDDLGGLIITSNKDLGQLAEAWEDDSIPSRIAGMSKVIGFSNAADIRLKRRNT